MRIELACAECGRNRFVFPDQGSDDAEVSCADCGHVVGTMGALKDAVAAAVIRGDSAPTFRRGEAPRNDR
jgi:ribosomal protein S27E